MYLLKWWRCCVWVGMVCCIVDLVVLVDRWLFLFEMFCLEVKMCLNKFCGKEKIFFIVGIFIIKLFFLIIGEFCVDFVIEKN